MLEVLVPPPTAPPGGADVPSAATLSPGTVYYAEDDPLMIRIGGCQIWDFLGFPAAIGGDIDVYGDCGGNAVTWQLQGPGLIAIGQFDNGSATLRIDGVAVGSLNAAISGIAFIPVVGDILKWIGKSLRIGSKAFVIAERQLQSHFKHAPDFGITGPWNKANGQAFREAIEQHVRSTPRTAGRWHGQPGTWYLDPNTGVGVFADAAGNYVTNFRLTDAQLRHSPNLGGG